MGKDSLSVRDESFPETEYGIVKRIRVIHEWVSQVAARVGRHRLAILDYGCGTGDHITFPLAQAGHEVLGVDIHEPSIREARRKYTLPNLSFRTGDVQDLIDAGLAFDVIVCSEVLEHLHNPRQFLQELRRLLRPGGGLIITTPNGYGSFEMLRRLEGVLSRIGVHQALRWIFRKGRHLTRRVRHPGTRSQSSEKLSVEPGTGFLNQDSVHVQFFRLRSLERLFLKSGFHVVGRRARTFLCGPYVDTLFRLSPGRKVLFQVNNGIADVLPLSWAADWMFLLELKDGIKE